ncbi:hypothetical protein BBJ28_00005831 [Nothophytophthora sp. Chile5]|nr:hypothetical protein BBJ28_00005831 [Nothophytophthora sp. Chile5]
MAQEPVAASPSAAEHVMSPLEMEAVGAPSPGSATRKGRKKHHRRQSSTGSEAGAETTVEGGVSSCPSPMTDFPTNVATADLISLPSPVATPATPATDVFAEPVGHEDEAPTTVEEALADLSLTREDEMSTANGQAEPVGTTSSGQEPFLKLPFHQSSGRVPTTPPPTPEPFLVHSPDTGYSRVSPVTPGVQLPPVDMTVASGVGVTVDGLATAVPVVQSEVVDLEMDGHPTSSLPSTDLPVFSTEEQMTLETPPQDMELLDPRATDDHLVAEDEAEVTKTLSSTLAEMDLTSEDDPYNEAFHQESPVEGRGEILQTLLASENAAGGHSPATVPVQDFAGLHLSREDVPNSSNEEAVQGSPPSDEHASMPLPSPPSTEASLIPPSPTELIPVEAMAAPSEIAKEMEALLPTSTPQNSTDVSVEQSTIESAGGSEQKEVKASVETPQPRRRTKRKGDDAAEENVVPAPVAANRTASARVFVPRMTKIPPTTAEISGGLKQKTREALTKSTVPPRRIKRKGDAPETKPPPAPAALPIRAHKPMRATTQPHTSESALDGVKANLEASAKPTAVKRPIRGPKTDSMMNPTASSAARATAAEGRRILRKSTATSKALIRKPLRSTALSNPRVTEKAATNLGKELSITAAPDPITTAETADQRHVKRRLNTSEVEAATNRLYEDAKESKLRKDARRVELQETYSFAPQVNHKRRSIPEGTEELSHFARLHAQAKELLEKKRELQLQHEQDGCTFTPTITARAKRVPQTNSGPRYENLYKQAQTIKQKREEKIMANAKIMEEECPFKPKIKASKSPLKSRPLYDSEREKQKKLALEQKKIDTEMSACTFKPKVGLKRLKSKIEGTPDTAASAAADSTFYDRLYQASIQRAERLEKLRQEQNDKEKSEAPFQPKTTTSRSRAAKKSQTKATQPFHKRLYNKDYMQKLAAAREQRRLEGELQYTFKPQITEAPEEIKVKVKERGDSPGKSIFEVCGRLYEEKDKLKEKIELGEELRIQKEMAECTFRPQIDADGVNSSGEPAAPVWERLLTYDKTQVIEEREKLKEQLEMQECTFKPEVTSSEVFSIKRSPSYNIFDRLNGSGGNTPVDRPRREFYLLALLAKYYVHIDETSD